MNLIERYVFARICRPLAIYLFGGMFVLITQRTIELIDIVLEKRRSPGIILNLLVHWVPNYLAFAAYIGLYLAILFGFSRLSKNSEVTVMMSMGYGFPSITKLILLQASLIVAVSLLVIGWIQPHALHSFREMLHFVFKTEFVYLIEESTFFKKNNTVFFLEKIDHKAGRFKKIFIYKENEDRRTAVLTGESGGYLVDTKEHKLTFKLEKVAGLDLPAESYDYESQPIPAPKKIASDSILYDIGLEDAGTYRKRGTTEQELTLTELFWEARNKDRKIDLAKIRGEMHFRISQCLLAFILPFMAIPFSAGPPQSGRPYNIAIALLALVAIHQVLLTGRQFVKTLEMSPYLYIWAPMSIFCLVIILRYWRFCFKVPTNRGGFDLENLVNRRITWFRN